MFSFLDVVDGAKAIVPLFPSIINVIEQLSDEEEGPTLIRVVQQLRIDTLEGAQQLRDEITRILQDKSMDPQLAVPLKQLGDNLSWLRDPLKKRHVQKCRDRINQIHRDITNSTDELASVLACMQRLDGLTDVYTAAQAVRADLDGLLQSQPPLRKVLETYIKFLDSYTARLLS